VTLHVRFTGKGSRGHKLREAGGMCVIMCFRVGTSDTILRCTSKFQRQNHNQGSFRILRGERAATLYTAISKKSIIKGELQQEQ
jgi:hypothetical protein